MAAMLQDVSLLGLSIEKEIEVPRKKYFAAPLFSRITWFLEFTIMTFFAASCQSVYP